jgi:diaminohydroxyphosphoribosylaminopyrimidine deaminase/5-amino-6-(5-phosphoribosylamino)uracil reductase
MYMHRALELAALGAEWVSPNPRVGCVIVHNNTIIGEGFHRKYGEAHAEVNAILSVKDPSLLPESTVYVTLEPCAHFGKTPPCADLLIKHRVKKVVICNKDPFTKVAGRGIEKLKSAGIEVSWGELEELGREINRRFFKVQETGLPYIILKWAQSLDGFMGGSGSTPVKISNSLTDLQVHRWRAEEDAILIGRGTAEADNPRLNVRHWITDKQPKRIVLGIPQVTGLQLNDESTIFLPHEEDLRTQLSALCKQGIHSILVEGGRKIHESFLKEGIFDEIRVITGSITIHTGIPAPTLPQGLKLTEQSIYLEDIVKIYRPLPTL